MRWIVICCAAWLSLQLNIAHAVPTAFYNPANGSIYLANDTGAPLALVGIKSPSGRLTGVPLSIPGTTMDPADMPFVLAYLSLPPSTSDPHSWSKVGTLIPGGGYRGDLEITYLASFAPGQTEKKFVFFAIPEPTSLAMASLGMAIVAVTVRRRTARADFVCPHALS